jgi:hypothetical protein
MDAQYSNRMWHEMSPEVLLFYEDVASFIRWAIAGVFLLIMVLPMAISFSSYI